MGSVYVTNRNPEPHMDKFNGEEFLFPTGEPVLVSEAAAQHMLGYGLENKTDILVRLGWAVRLNEKGKQYEDNPEGVKQLARFVFEEAVMAPRSALAAAMKRDVDTTEIA